MYNTPEGPKPASNIDPAAILERFLAQCACDQCGSAPDPKTIHLTTVVVSRGLFLLAGYACSVCGKVTVAKRQVL